MYTQSKMAYQSAMPHNSSKVKSCKLKTNYFCEQFNHIFRNKDRCSADALFDRIRDLTIQFIAHSANQKHKKMVFEDILTNNLSFGNISRNKNIVLFHIKLAELYLKSQLDFRILLKSIDSLKQFYLLQTNFHECFYINLALLPSIKNQKLRQTIEKVVCYLFKFIEIQQNEKHQNFINLYLSQSVTTGNFPIFFEITNAYYQRLRQKPFNYPFIDVNFILKKFFEFEESKRPQFQYQYQHILNRYYKLYQVPHYLPYLTKDLQNIFLLITNWTDLNQGKENQFIMIYLYNILSDLLNQGVNVIIPQYEIKAQELKTPRHKLHFFMNFYIKNLKNQQKKSLSEIDLEDLENYFIIISKNIDDLILSDHNFIRVIDRIVNEIQKIKRDFLRELSLSDKILLLKNKKNLHSIQVLTKITEIQNAILSNKVYLALDNFKNSSFFATSGLIEITIQSFTSTRKTFADSILKKWVDKIDLLNLEPINIEGFYITLLNFLTKKYNKGLQNNDEISFLFKCFDFIIDRIPSFLSSNLLVLNYWHYIIRKLITYFSEKLQSNLCQTQNFQQIDGIQNFVKKFTQYLSKNAFSYLENLHRSGESLINIREEQTFNHQKDLISYSVILFCFSFEILSNQDISNFLKIFAIQLQSQKIGQFSGFIRKQILQKLEASIFMILNNRKINGHQIDFLQMEFFLNVYRKMTKLGKEKKEQKFEYCTIYSNLKSINFAFNLKKIINQEKECNSLKELIQNFQESHLGCSSQNYINKLFDQDVIPTTCRQNYLEIMLDLLVKKIYFTTHPQSKGYDNFNKSIDKTGFAEVDESKQQIPGRQHNTKRQRREKQQKQFQRNIINFENSCIAIGKVKALLTKVFGSIQQIIHTYELNKVHQNFQLALFNQKYISNFENIFNLLGFTWNILWMLKICDMEKQMLELLKIRLGIFYYFSTLTGDRAFFQFQAEKLSYFELIDTSTNFQAKQSFQEKLLKNTIPQFEIGNIKSRIEIIIYLLNNLPSSKNFKPLVSYVSAFIFDYNKLNEETLSKAKVNFFPFFQPVPQSKKTAFKMDTIQLRSEFLIFDQTEIIYPLITKIFRKLLFFVKKNNQISQIRALLSLITCYFSKIGLGIYFNEVVDLWLIKNVKISILKVIDCYQIFLNNSLRNYQQNQSNDKLKLFLKIDRMLCNKRRSVSALFTLKMIVDLLKEVRDSGISMSYNICQIIMKQFKQQFNLYNYEAQTILNHIYPNKKHGNYSGNGLYSFQTRRLNEISDKVVFQKQFFKKLTDQTFKFALQSLYFLNQSIVKFVLLNFETGKIVQSLIGFFVEFIHEFRENDQKPQRFQQAVNLIDETLVKLAVTMLQFNYEYKICVYESFQIENEFSSIFNQLQKNKVIFAKFYQNFESGVLLKLKFLKPSQKKSKSKDFGSNLLYPLSIIYPLRNYVYNIAFIDSILITKVDMFDFDHSFTKIEEFIDNDSEIIFKEKSVKDWWKGRTRLDRQMGKIAESTNLGVFDVKVEDHLHLRSYSNKSFGKFLYTDSQDAKNHIKEEFEKYEIDITKQAQILNEMGKIQQLMMVNSGSNEGNFKINQSILILTINRLSIFPFQKLKPLQRYSGVYRVPSVRYIIEQQKLRQKNSSSYSIRNLSYAVNIHNDLKKTQRKFQEIKESIYKKLGGYLRWQGSIGQQPSKSQYQSYLAKQVYVYMGHGAGMGHIKEKQFYRSSVRSVSMLFGCSSINMDHQFSQQHGIPLILLKNNCPALLGSNWEITDTDTDLLTTKIFERITTEKSIDMSVCLQQAKKSIKLSNLNGGAIIVYGLPCQLSF